MATPEHTYTDWEADLVQQLVRGTVGSDNDFLADYAKDPRS